MKKNHYQFVLLCLFISAFINSVPGQWTPAGSLSNPGTYPRISVVDSNIVWVCGGTGNNARVWRTIDGGNNWSSLNTTGLPHWLDIIYAKDSLTAFVGDGGGAGFNGGNAKLFKTTNGGVNWILIDSTGGTMGWFSGINFAKLSPDFGFAVSDPPNGPGTPFFFTKSTDGGFTWTRDFVPGVFGAFTLGFGSFCIDENFYGFLIIKSTYADSTRVYLTTNGGMNWQIRFPGASYGTTNIGWCDFNNDKSNAILVNTGMLPNIAKTTNGGLNWNISNTGVNGLGDATVNWISGTNIVFLSSNYGPSGSIFRSDDNGETWETQQTSGIQGIIDKGFFRTNDFIYGFAINVTGNIIKTKQTIIPIGITTISGEIPEKYKLYQNYPNPFNPSSKIKFQIPEPGYTLIKVYDEIGREISTLVNGYLKAGIYETEFDGGKLTSGLYFYKLVSRNYSETKKMVLIK